MNKNTQNMNTKELNISTKEMLIGCLLGDAHIGKIGSDKAFITFEQSSAHKDYIMDIYQQLKNNGLALHDVKCYSRKDSRYNSTNTSFYFKTHNTELLYPLANMFLSDTNNKILPPNIEDNLSPRALAFWICDDGQLVKKGAITLCTDNYTLSEVESIIEALTKRYNLKCSIHYKKGKAEKIYHRIYINKTSLENIKPLVTEYVHKSFLYKLHIS